MAGRDWRVSKRVSGGRGRPSRVQRVPSPLWLEYSMGPIQPPKGSPGHWSEVTSKMEVKFGPRCCCSGSKSGVPSRNFGFALSTWPYVAPSLMPSTLRGRHMLKRMAYTVAICCLAPTAANATVLATCGASSGQARWENPPTWIADGIKDGVFQFSATENGTIHLKFIDVTGALRDVEDRGGKVHTAFADSKLVNLDWSWCITT